MSEVRRRFDCPKCKKPFWLIFNGDETLGGLGEVRCPRDCDGSVRVELPRDYRTEPGD